MPQPRITQPKPVIPGWRVLRSDAGRLWATRELPFDPDAERAGASRTVDGDDPESLLTAVTAQEKKAAEATHPLRM